MKDRSVAEKSKEPVAARLFILLARKAPIAVIFRRGPSRWGQLIKWSTDSDTFQFGQWFHGRIYERRGDLSPDGAFLVYFAQKLNARTLKDYEYGYSWTAISKPPYLTALALWLKGDCWDGGGLFRNNKTLELNHFLNKPHPDHKPPGWLHVIAKITATGEDDPIFSERLLRDGWNVRQEWVVKNQGHPKYFVTSQPEVREKPSRNGKRVLRLTRSIQRLDYVEGFSVTDQKGSWEKTIDGASWMDWDQSGRLVFLRGGQVFAGAFADSGSRNEILLADLNASHPAPLVAPPWAMKW